MLCFATYAHALHKSMGPDPSDPSLKINQGTYSTFMWGLEPCRHERLGDSFNAFLIIGTSMFHFTTKSGTLNYDIQCINTHAMSY